MSQVLKKGKFNYFKKIEDLKLENIFLKTDKLKKIIETNSKVEKYEVFKNYPSSITVNIKTKFLAKINVDGTIFLIGQMENYLKFLKKMICHLFLETRYRRFFKF